MFICRKLARTVLQRQARLRGASQRLQRLWRGEHGNAFRANAFQTGLPATSADMGARSKRNSFGAAWFEAHESEAAGMQIGRDNGVARAMVSSV
jgi:hypothetical protein